jgi:hypothetical protein
LAVKKTQQHPALTAEQNLTSAIYLAGSLLLCVAILVQLFMRADALYPAIFVVGCSRIALAFWQMFRPLSFITERTQPGLVFNIVAWGSTLIVLIWMRGR